MGGPCTRLALARARIGCDAAIMALRHDRCGAIAVTEGHGPLAQYGLLFIRLATDFRPAGEAQSCLVDRHASDRPALLVVRSENAFRRLCTDHLAELRAEVMGVLNFRYWRRSRRPAA